MLSTPWVDESSRLHGGDLVWMNRAELRHDKRKLLHE